MRTIALSVIAISSVISMTQLVDAQEQTQDNGDWQIVDNTSSQADNQSHSRQQRARGSSANISSFKLGMGLDQGLSVVAQFNRKLNLAVGNDGVAADYIFDRGSFGSEVPFAWFVGAGGQIHKFEEVGPRLTLGVELPFAQRWDGYAQLSPNIMFGDNDAKLGINAGFGIRFQF